MRPIRSVRSKCLVLAPIISSKSVDNRCGTRSPAPILLCMPQLALTEVVASSARGPRVANNHRAPTVGRHHTERVGSLR